LHSRHEDSLSHEDGVKTKSCSLLIAMMLFALMGGCQRGGDTHKTETATIAPATPPPTPADTEAVQTQTVEIGEQRSPNEGGVLTDEEHAPTTTETTGTTSTR
jgi:hypothetical protein